MKKISYEAKKDYLSQLLDESSSDITAVLRINAITKYGLVNDEIRKRAWPKLLDASYRENDIIITNRNDYENHFYYNQVVMDIERTLKRFPPGLDPSERLVLQNKAINIIMSILYENDDIHYYQGYHDIAITIILVLTEEKPSLFILKQITPKFLKDFTGPTGSSGLEFALSYTYPIIACSNPRLALFLENKMDLNPPLFCLPQMITWFARASHTASCNNVNHRQIYPNQAVASRVFEVFVATRDPRAPLYLCAAQLISSPKIKDFLTHEAMVNTYFKTEIYR
ncbi:unnamed protein product [Gordionus sp. m RMFG-2023]